jgi:hypothetical protein
MNETLGLCPTTKLLHATDATRYPQVYFVAATRHREAVAEALGDSSNREMMSVANAESAACLVLAENARPMYRLGTNR